MKIESCTALFIWALRDGRAVTGPKLPVVPPTPNYEAYCGSGFIRDLRPCCKEGLG
ncbi:MAG: hypothetical protein NTU95_10250 [Methanothrix sp.]|nr:hypothetical protein [Methanothrix sp.]